MLSPVLVSRAAALILLTQSAALPTSRLPEKVPPPCTVSGRVVTATDGTPLKSSHVALLPEHASRNSHVYAALSDGSGRFTIKDAPAGRYRFLATHTGYVDKYYHSTGDDTGAVLALNAGDDLKDIFFA